MSELKEKMNQILEEKNKLTPEVLKKGTTVFGVEGSLEEGSGEYNAIMDTNIESNAAYVFNKLIKEYPQLDTSKITVFGNMFNGCSNLREISQLDTGSGTSFFNMFRDCSNLQEIPKIDTSKGTTFDSMFFNCSSLQEIPQFNFENALVITDIVSNCSNLQNLGGFKDLGKAYFQKKKENSPYTLNLRSCSKLTHESLLNVINNLYDLNLTYGETLYRQQVKLHADSMALLSEDEIKIATDKGWDIV